MSRVGKTGTKFHPAMPPKKSRKDGAVSLTLAKNRAKRAIILARTAAGIAKLAKARVGADMSDLEHLPTITFLPRPAPPLILDDQETSQYKAPPMAPPVDGFVETLDTLKPNRKRSVSTEREKVRASIAQKAARELAESAMKRAA